MTVNQIYNSYRKQFCTLKVNSLSNIHVLSAFFVPHLFLPYRAKRKVLNSVFLIPNPFVASCKQPQPQFSFKKKESKMIFLT